MSKEPIPPTPTLDEAIEQAEHRLWELHARLGQPYSSGGRHAQLEDAIALGKLAERIKLMIEARREARVALPIVRKESE